MVDEAGLPAGLSPHSRRKAAARRLAEAGCSANQIAAVTGHATLREVARYTAAASQERLADDANQDERLAKNGSIPLKTKEA